MRHNSGATTSSLQHHPPAGQADPRGQTAGTCHCTLHNTRVMQPRQRHGSRPHTPVKDIAVEASTVAGAITPGSDKTLQYPAHEATAGSNRAHVCNTHTSGTTQSQVQA
jgi:hypothetical protein